MKRTKTIMTAVDVPGGWVCNVCGHDIPDKSGCGEGNAVEENKVFGKYTPCGELTMTIHNPAAFAQFDEGQQYYIDITPAE